MSTFYSKGRTAGAAAFAVPEEAGNKLVEAEVEFPLDLKCTSLRTLF
jgi:hypothetical protein